MTAERPPKVVVASRLFTPEVGAASFRLQALVDGLVAQGADVSVVTTRPPQGSPGFNAPYRLSRWPVLRDAGGNVR
ncbi:MAG: glycosyltransferase WbuB, partial [Actinomycetota bacterium]|nr:glycosyltransferase WbuB [Actinomycetota bacterium]